MCTLYENVNGVRKITVQCLISWERNNQERTSLQKSFFLLIFKIILFIFSSLAVLGLHCCCGGWASYVGGFSGCRTPSPGCLGFSSCSAQVQQLWLRGSGPTVGAHRPSCSAARGIFQDQASKPCHLRWQADSPPLAHQGSPHSVYFYSIYTHN